MTTARIAGAPISWGVCEVPDWGHQLPAERVLAEMRALGLEATEFGPPGFLPKEPEALAARPAAAEALAAARSAEEKAARQAEEAEAAAAAATVARESAGAASTAARASPPPWAKTTGGSFAAARASKAWSVMADSWTPVTTIAGRRPPRRAIRGLA